MQDSIKQMFSKFAFSYIALFMQDSRRCHQAVLQEHAGRLWTSSGNLEIWKYLGSLETWIQNSGILEADSLKICNASAARKPKKVDLSREELEMLAQRTADFAGSAR